MDLKQKLEPLVSSVFEMDKFIEEKGYDVVPFNENGKVGFFITKDGIVVKKGEKRYSSWKEGRRQILNKLCKALGL